MTLKLHLCLLCKLRGCASEAVARVLRVQREQLTSLFFCIVFFGWVGWCTFDTQRWNRWIAWAAQPIRFDADRSHESQPLRRETSAINANWYQQMQNFTTGVLFANFPWMSPGENGQHEISKMLKEGDCWCFSLNSPNCLQAPSSSQESPTSSGTPGSVDVLRLGSKRGRHAS